MGIITDQLNALHEAESQTQRVLAAKQSMSTVMGQIIATVGQVEALAAAGDLNDIPAETIAALTAAFNALVTCMTTMQGDATIQEALNWQV